MLLNVISLGCLVIKVPKSMYKVQICQRAVQMWHFDIKEVNMFLRAEIRRTEVIQMKQQELNECLPGCLAQGSLAEERLVVLFLLGTKFSMSTSRAGGGDAFGSLRGLFTLLKQHARRGERGCLQDRDGYYYLYSMQYVTVYCVKYEI